MNKFFIVFKRTIFLFLIILFILSRFDNIVFKKTPDLISHYKQKIIKRAHTKGIFGFFSFDEGIIKDEILGKTTINYGAALKEGVKNGARYFNGSNKIYIDTDYHWGNLESQYTISLYVKIEQGKSTQTFLCQHDDRLKSGIMLQNGRIVFYVPYDKKTQMASYEFDNYNKWVHLVGVCDLNNKTALIYENGILKDKVEIENVTHLNSTVKFGKYRPKSVYYPFKGAIDEVVFFKRALPEKEIKKLYSEKSSLYKIISPTYLLKYNLLNKLYSSILFFENIFDFFNPLYHESHAFKSDIPQIDLILSKNDLKHLNREFNQAKRNGFFKNNEKRKAEVFFNNKLSDIRIKLYAHNQNYIPYQRKPFLLESENFEESKAYILQKSELNIEVLKNKPLKKLVLIPFDDSKHIMPIFYSKLLNKYLNQNIVNGYLTLKINSVFSGIYYYEVFDEGKPLLFQYDKNNISFENLRKKIELIYTFLNEETIMAFYNDLKIKYEKILLSDRTAYKSKREIKYNIKNSLKELKKELKSFCNKSDNDKINILTDFITPYIFLNENPTPLYITDDLNFSIFNLPNTYISFYSLNSSYISHEGKVIRDVSSHIDSEINISIKIKNEKREKKLFYTVIPLNVKLPRMIINIPQEIHSIHKKKCSIVYINDKKIIYGAKINLRGNTALFYEKKSFSIRTDKPHNIFKNSPSKEFNLMGVLPDKTLMRNSLAYNLFNSFKDDISKNNIAPSIKLIEVFLNNEYLGIYELSEKVDENLLNLKFNINDKEHSFIYKAQGGKATFEGVRWRNYLQKFPKIDDIVYNSPYKKLMKFISSAPTEIFNKKIAEYIDIYNCIDFHILVNLTFNKDGINHNLFLFRNIDLSKNIFIVPWDYDKSFGLNTDGWLDNYLFKRLRHEFPGYKDKFKERWNYLRQNQLKYESIINRIDELESIINPRIRYNLLKWKIDEKIHEKAYNDLKSWILERLTFLDIRINSL